MIRRALATLTLALAAAGTFTACGNSESEALCRSLDNGVPGFQAIGQMNNAGQDPLGTLERASKAIRSNCPQHNDQADGIDLILNPTEMLPKLAPGFHIPTDPTLRSCVMSGTPEDQCRSMIASGVTGG